MVDTVWPSVCHTLVSRQNVSKLRCR